ncbi:MAG: NAD-dependent epimerase/dehydratase family protein [Candidatus Brocadiia bacterium]
MKVLLTGANGFVGSHILDQLCAAGHPVRVLLRKTSRTGFIEDHLPGVEVRYGSVTDPGPLRDAVQGADCVIHCAGKTKAVRAAEYDAVNLEGTRNVVAAVNAEKATVKHLVHISSLAANHPAGADAPALETDAPRPVSEYGRSKLRAEELVRETCQAPFTILRPSAVYGPRDADFLPVFKAVRRHLMPLIGGGRMQLSLVCVGDVAAAALRCLGNPQAYRKTYHVASPEPCSTRDFLREIAAVMNVRTVPIFIPFALLYPVALGRELLARATGKPNILSRQKLREMKAPGWVCSTDLIRRDLQFTAGTRLSEGIARTITWYEQNGWL